MFTKIGLTHSVGTKLACSSFKAAKESRQRHLDLASNDRRRD